LKAKNNIFVYDKQRKALDTTFNDCLSKKAYQGFEKAFSDVQLIRHSPHVANRRLNVTNGLIFK
jgi:hypothetical protein